MLDEVAEEYVIMGAELVQTIRVDVARRLLPLVANLLRCLPALKLHDQLTHHARSLAAELLVGRVDHGNDLLIFGVVVGVALKLRDPVIRLRENLAVGDDCLAAVRFGNRVGRERRSLRLGLAPAIPGLIAHGLAQVLTKFVGCTALSAVPVHLLVLLLALVLKHLVEVVGNGNNVIVGLGNLNAVDDPLLRCGDGNIQQTEGAELEVEVDLVNDAHFREIGSVDLEDVKGENLLVACVEVTTASGEPLLDEPFDAGILNDIEASLIAALVQLAGLRIGNRLHVDFRRSEQRMGNLMRDEHIAQDIRHFPVGQRQDAGLKVEGCRLCAIIEGDKDVLRSESAGKHGGRNGNGVGIEVSHGCVPIVRDVLSAVNGGREKYLNFLSPHRYRGGSDDADGDDQVRQVVVAVTDGTTALLENPSRDALHVDGLGNRKEIGLLEVAVVSVHVAVRVLLGGIDETIALVEVRHGVPFC